MLLKLATSSSELAEIIDLRKRVFVEELKIQNPDYQDVFNDYFCKNLMVIKNQQLLGAIRVAFDRHTQRFYASYFVTASSKRNRTTGVLLVGGMLRIMRENRIQTLYADSHQQILKEYLNFGCEIMGKPYRKYGFSCEWTPIRYQLSECTSAGNWMLERASQFLSSQQCQWKFPVQLIFCRTIEEYETVSLVHEVWIRCEGVLRAPSASRIFPIMIRATIRAQLKKKPTKSPVAVHFFRPGEWRS